MYFLYPIFLILISLIIFTGRNINRINKEIKKYNYDLISSPTYIVKKNHFRIDLFINKLIEKYGESEVTPYKLMKVYEEGI